MNEFILAIYCETDFTFPMNEFIRAIFCETDFTFPMNEFILAIFCETDFISNICNMFYSLPYTYGVNYSGGCRDCLMAQ